MQEYKCDKCGKTLADQRDYAVPGICRDCFAEMDEQEKAKYFQMMNQMAFQGPYPFRVGFGKRLGAYILDFLFFMVLLFIFMFAFDIVDQFQYLTLQDIVNQDVMEDFQRSVAPLLIVLAIIYYSLEIVFARTPGKMILGIKIAKDDRTEARTRDLLLRFVVKHVNYILDGLALLLVLSFINVASSFLNLIVIIGCFFVLGQRRQAIHDMIAGTAVYHQSDINNTQNK